MKQRIITGFFLVLLVLSMLYFQGTYLRLWTLLILMLGLKELLALYKPSFNIVHAYVYLASALLFISYPDVVLLPSYAFMAYLIGLFCLSIIVEDFTFDKLAMMGMMSLLINVGLRGMCQMVLLEGVTSLIFVFLTTYGCDTFAYFTGYFFGRHKLIERISPKKTIEGSLGGMFFGTLFGGLFGMTFLPIPTMMVWLLAFLLTITSQFGDLTFSSLKRHYHIKDFSHLLPGHGGVLDRIDSLVFNIVVYVCFCLILL